MFNDEYEDSDDNENDDDMHVQHHMMSSVEALRDHMLQMFGTFLSKIMDDKDVANVMTHQRNFLEVWEVEGILKDMSDVSGDGYYGIGANSPEEYQEKMGALFRALTTRVVSNIMQLGVKRGLLDSEYDFEKGEFAFSVTEAGVAYLASGQEKKDGSANHDEKQ